MDIISYALSKKGMQQSVSDYLDEHLTNPTNPPLDTSLEIAGAAADSKATGDKLSELKDELTSISDEVDSVVLTGTSLIPFIIPQNTVIALCTKGGESLPSLYVEFYDSTKIQLKYYGVGSNYGNTRIIYYTESTCSYVKITSAYANGIVVKIYEDRRNKEPVDANYFPLALRRDAVPLGNYSIGDVVDVSSLYNPSPAHYILFLPNVKAGEKFTIHAVDGNTSRPWAFLDSSFHLLDMAYNAYAEDVEITAPSNTEYLIVQVGNAHASNAYIYRHQTLEYLSNGHGIGINDFNPTDEVTEAIENAVSIVKNDGNTIPKNRSSMFSLLHFSDIHGDAVNIQRILDFADIYSKYLYDIIHTGDAPITYYGDTNPFSLVGGKQIMEVVGNHECWKQGDTWPTPYNATAQEVYTKFFAPYIADWGVTSAGENLCYYYKDYATAKVRLIVLDCIHYDATQESWFETALAGAKTNNYRVVAVTHYPAMTGITNIDCDFTSYGATISATTPPTGTDQVERMPESAFTCVDTFISNGGEFVCWLSGHAHGDVFGTVTGHGNQIQILVASGKPLDNGVSDSARIKGTKSQDAFNVFVVDGTNKLIKLIRIGADKNRHLQTRKTFCFNYQTKTVIG